MFKKKRKNDCEFGKYKDTWEHHLDNCKVIIRITDNYIVFLDKENDLDWETTEHHDASIPNDYKKQYDKTLSQCTILEHQPINGLSKDSIKSFKSIIGEAIVTCLEQNYEVSENFCTDAEKFRMDRLIEKSREWYLSFSILFSAIIVFFCAASNSSEYSLRPLLLEHINIGAWAVAGSCLSIILRSGKLQHASYAGIRLHIIESFSRLVGGFLSGQLIFLGLQSGVVLSTLANVEHYQQLTYFMALLAGASERIAPSIITIMENTTSKETKVKDE